MIRQTYKQFRTFVSNSDFANTTKFELQWAATNEQKIASILKAKHTKRWVDCTICKTTTISEAIQVYIQRGISALMVVDREMHVNSLTHQKGKVLGMLTSRDLLRRMAKGISLTSPEKFSDLADVQINEFITPLNKVVFGRPDENVRKARSIMGKTGMKCLPIIKDGRVEGILTNRDISEFHFSALERGGKKQYLADLSERVGLSFSSMAEPPLFISEQIHEINRPLYVNFSAFELPHPFKTANGVASNLRAHGPADYSSDVEFSEDAYFLKVVEFKRRKFVYAGVADGVGSWRQWGVDPRLFSRSLMRHCEDALSEKEKDKKDGESAPKPHEIMKHAHKRVIEDNVIGSCTSCVMVFDEESHQIHFSNIGDSGIIVLRHIDLETAGAKGKKSDLRAAFVSQQQLKSFNFPYQLGWTGKELGEEEGDDHAFKSASDYCNNTIHVRRGDIVICASDGLFDNVEIEEISRICQEWEIENGFIDADLDMEARGKRWRSQGGSKGDVSKDKVKALSESLVRRARELSLDDGVDSPFAVLAKDNDIMWSGGMPDDCTVLCFHVVGHR